MSGMGDNVYEDNCWDDLRIFDDRMEVGTKFIK